MPLEMIEEMELGGNSFELCSHRGYPFAFIAAVVPGLSDTISCLCGRHRLQVAGRCSYVLGTLAAMFHVKQ